MSTNRYILEDLVRKLPAGAVPSGYNVTMLTEEQLQDIVVANVIGVPMTFPLYLKVEGGEWWLLPYEPQITLQGTNIIVKKQVSKGSVRGTIKERWSQGDYQVNISGILIGKQGEYPGADVKLLRAFCEAGRVLVKSPLLEIFSINQVVIESWSMPFTAGVANQAYTISALSDDIYKLLLRKEDLKQVSNDLISV